MFTDSLPRPLTNVCGTVQVAPHYEFHELGGFCIVADYLLMYHSSTSLLDFRLALLEKGSWVTKLLMESYILL